VLVAVAATLVLFTAPASAGRTPARAAGYVGRMADGSVAVYAGDDLRTPNRRDGLSPSETLREARPRAARRRASRATKEEVLQLLEDLGN
jgi:hypothetical protein